MQSILGKIGFEKWIKTNISEVLNEDIDGTIEEAIIDDFYKAEDIFKLLEQAFKAGVYYKK